MNNIDYWIKTFNQLEEDVHNKGDTFNKELEKQYDIVLYNILREINNWYIKFAKDNKINMQEAEKLLNLRELAELKLSLEEYIKYGEENVISQKWMKELESAVKRVRISRLEALELKTRHQIEVLYSKEYEDVNTLIADTYQDSYYHTTFETQKGIGIGLMIAMLSMNNINKIVSSPWTTDGITFGNRIWNKHRPRLMSELNKGLKETLINGVSPENLTNKINKNFNTSKEEAKLLVKSELAFFSSLSQRDCFNSLGVETYEIVSASDSRVCEKRCSPLDGKVIEMKYYEIGITAPPFHPRCRCVVVPYFDGEESYRDAREEDGETYYIPSNMKYNEWYSKYVKDSSSSGAISRKRLKDLEIYLREEKHANLYYEEIRKRTSDIKAIARNTGYSEKVIQDIKNHVFMNKYNLYGGYKSFDPSYDMAISWQRLIEGKDIKKCDIILLKHERLEKFLMDRYNYDYKKAHGLVVRKYDYEKALREG
ncbi:minor capsid protein [Clostridioides difficile]|nr:minor capsid protein [Clostridioides difficile]MBZ1287812.1 minor capsid protein [Clostridioides difficile]MCE4686942.1 minor capsid protein [Clostridioides difficile]MCW0603590.1 minor capsid protein [Clostridioides difficile]MDC2939958.1 minor capsid protein [Clostridioides difficile]